MTTLLSMPSHIYIFAAILGLLLLSFVFFSLLPSFVVSRQLSAVTRKLVLLNGKPDGSLDQIFRNNGVLEHLWHEYADSLHKQDGQIVRLRSTMPAGVVFRPDILVDIPLRTDFFKHLPGLFTGVGIIGTFYGLLVGLKSFVISENTAIVRDSLTRLLHGVSEAFLISASAITLAMIITFIEKLMVSRLNAKVETLVQLLDGMFEGGAGEEYLARLVRASEASSAQTLLKGELRQMLAELSSAQIAAANAGSLALGNRIATAIEEGLKTPLLEIADSLKHARDDQGMQSMLSDMFENFNRQMQELIASQTSDKDSLQQQTVEALQATVARLEAMAQSADAGQHSTAAMAEQVAAVVASAESRQAIMSDKLAEFIEQMQLATSHSQSASHEQLQSALNELSGRMGSMVDGLDAQVLSVTGATMQHQQDMDEQTQAIVGQFGNQVADMIEGVKLAVVEIQSAVAVMHTTTTEAMSALGSSADTLHLASREFARAGQSVTLTLDKSVGVADQLIQSAGSVSAASTGLSDLFGDYKSSRNTMLEQMQALQLLAEQVRRDASMSGEVLEKIEAATASLVTAQRDADNYLSKISGVIGVAHQSFSEGMIQVVGEANREFHQALSDSVKLLREGIHELESTLDAATNV
ncbi:MAG: hypothetical protein NTY60_10945 [Proteobacteria bacterium]|nr:hypothetical protein [Pseudomonadota bacterium]